MEPPQIQSTGVASGIYERRGRGILPEAEHATESAIIPEPYIAGRVRTSPNRISFDCCQCLCVHVHDGVYM